jgi:hypothetical protein
LNQLARSEKAFGRIIRNWQAFQTQGIARGGDHVGRLGRGTQYCRDSPRQRPCVAGRSKELVQARHVGEPSQEQ